MAINSNDIKLLQSERLTDTDDGGGRATGRVVESGAINEIFPPIDRIDQAFGEFSARKLFGGPQTPDTAAYYGAHSAIIQDARDPNINVLMVDTKSDTDTLRDLKDFVESYQVKAARTTAQLWGEHLQYQQSILIFQPLEEKIPAPNDVMFLKHGDIEQPIRIKSVQAEIRTVPLEQVNNNGVVTVELRRVMIDIFNQLETNFPGGQPSVSFSNKHTEFYTARPSTGVKYFGVKRLVKALSAGQSLANVGNPFLSLAPASKRNEVLVNQNPYETQKVSLDTGHRIKEYPNMQLNNAEHTVFFTLQHLIAKGSKMVVAERYGENPSEFEYVGGGDFRALKLGTRFLSATLDERTKKVVVKMPGAISYAGPVSIDGTLAIEVTGEVKTAGLFMEPGNHRTNYIFDLSGAEPSIPSIEFQYRALGKTYFARVDSNGNVTGDATGRFDVASGILQVTLPVLADLGTMLIVTWIDAEAQTLYTIKNRPLEQACQLAYTLEQAAEVGSVAIRWTSNGESLLATDDSKGNLLLSGRIVGRVAYANADGVAEIVFTPSEQYPDVATNVNIDYRKVTSQSQIFELNGGGQDFVVTLDTPPAPGSVNFSVVTHQYYDELENKVLTTDAIKEITRRWGDDGNGLFAHDEETLSGNINYSNGELHVRPCAAYQRFKISTVGRPVTGGYSTSGMNKPPISGGVTPYAARSLSTFSTSMALPHNTRVYSAWVDDIEALPAQHLVVRYQLPGVVGVELTESFPVTSLSIKLSDQYSMPIIPGSVVINSDNKTITDKNGILLIDIDPATGAGTQIGTINYESYTVNLADWSPTDRYTLDLLATAITASYLDFFIFPTVAAPLARDGIIVNATGIDGTRYSGTMDEHGVLKGDLSGEVNLVNGLIMAYVEQPGDPTQRKPLLASSIRYSCIVEQLVPLDKDVIKIDPIRLPPDGRVPIYREGDLLLMAHTQHDAIATPTAGQTVAAGRDYLAFLDVVDSKNKALKSTQFSADLLAGRITFATPLNLVDELNNALTPPLTLVHRVEHMTPISSVTINGDIGLLTPPYHDYPAQETMVCSCPIHGDKWARESYFFTQSSWNNSNPTWSNEPIGGDTSAKFDTLNYPVELTNDGAVNERFALVFTSANTFNVVGETLGIIAQGNISDDLAPLNPNTQKPYFVLRAAGWGTGWATNNVVRFNTSASISPIWLIRVTQPGRITEDQDEFIYQMRGDVV